jgi:hypothetical protein
MSWHISLKAEIVAKCTRVWRCFWLRKDVLSFRWRDRYVDGAMLVEKVFKTLESPPLRTGSHLGVDLPLRAVAMAVAMAVAAVGTLAVGLHAASSRKIRWRQRHGCRPDGPRRKGPGVAGHHDWRGKKRLAASTTPPRGRRGAALSMLVGLG